MYMGRIETSAPEKAKETTGVVKCIAGLCLLAIFIPYLMARIVVDGVRLLTAAIYSGLCSLGDTALREVSRSRILSRRA